MARGWQRIATKVADLPRILLWKAPAGPWTRGAILVLHGGGGRHFQWCVANAEIVAPQVRFSELALARGFAVFLLDSSDRVTDNEGRACGKVWDDEVRSRANLDLPFIEEVLRARIPALRPAGSREAIFMTGLSSGGYMTVRASTHFDDLVAAFAPVSCGDPYGWRRSCEKGLTPRTTVHGIALDNETQRQIVEPEACRAERYPKEKSWDSAKPATKPAFRVFHHEDDGVHDRSCGEKLIRQLRAHGYAGAPPFWLPGGGRRSFANHLWQDAYSAPLLEFFAGQPDRRR